MRTSQRIRLKPYQILAADAETFEAPQHGHRHLLGIEELLGQLSALRPP